MRVHRLIWCAQTVKRYKETERLLLLEKEPWALNRKAKSSADTLSPVLVLLHLHSTARGSWHRTDAP